MRIVPCPRQAFQALSTWANIGRLVDRRPHPTILGLKEREFVGPGQCFDQRIDDGCTGDLFPVGVNGDEVFRYCVRQLPKLGRDERDNFGIVDRSPGALDTVVDADMPDEFLSD